MMILTLMKIMNDNEISNNNDDKDNDYNNTG